MGSLAMTRRKTATNLQLRHPGSLSGTGGGMDWTDRIGRRLKPRDLHVFLAVAETGSMAKAAETLWALLADPK